MKLSIINFSIMLSFFGFSDGSTAEEKNFEKACLARHNYYRRLHGVPPLQLDSTISKFSKSWANKLSSNNEFKHSQNKKYGENLFTIWSSSSKLTINGSKAVDAWYSEIKYYTNYRNEPSAGVRSGAGHFTQLIWKKSQKLGVGLAKKNTRGGVKYVVVCNYSPPGNWIGEFTKNVLPPK